MHRTAASIAASALALIVLAGCATSADPDSSTSSQPSSSASPSASPEPSAAPTPDPSEPADPTADWAREDLGWASVPLPAGWTLERRTDIESMVVSDRGLSMVSLFRVPEGQYAQDLACLPEDLPAFEAVERLPYQGAEGATADAWAAAGTVVEVGTTVRELQIGFEGAVAYQVEMGITESPFLGAESCEPFFVTYPADGIPTGIAVVEDPDGGLRFDTRDEALAYLDTVEHQTLTDLLQGIRIR